MKEYGRILQQSSNDNINSAPCPSQLSAYYHSGQMENSNAMHSKMIIITTLNVNNNKLCIRLADDLL